MWVTKVKVVDGRARARCAMGAEPKIRRDRARLAGGAARQADHMLISG